MKFTCKQQNLSKAINTVSKAITGRTTLPILKGIYLKAEGEMLTLISSDLEISIEKKIDADITNEGETVIPARIFGDIIRKLPNSDIEIELKEDGILKIKCNSSKFEIVCFPVDEFPSIGEVKTEKSISINREIFRDMIKMTSFAASIDESKGIITGLLMEMEENNINMISLDGFRMAMVRKKVENKDAHKIIISAKIVNEIYKIISETEEENIEIGMDLKKAIISLENTKIITRLMEGEFINYKGIIPTENKISVIINRADFLESIERASLFSREGKNNLIKISIFDSNMNISSRSEEGNVDENIVVSQTGENIEIGFNSKYMMDVLKVIDEEEIKLEFNKSITPCLVRPIEGEEFLYLVLPVRLSGN